MRSRHLVPEGVSELGGAAPAPLHHSVVALARVGRCRGQESTASTEGEQVV